MPPLRREKEIIIDDREELTFILSEAATLEQMVMCGYLYAAFSIKHEEGQGLDSKELALVGQWDRAVSEVAVQEMLHLSLVNNLLTSIGAAPHFLRPNFPVHSKYFASAMQMVLLPFGEQALRHFLYLERPEGMAMRDAKSLSRKLERSKVRDHLELVPATQEFSTIGHLYRGIEKGLVRLAEKYGEKRLFVGSTRTQATEESFGWPELVTVHDLKSAAKAVETIIVEGEGARGDWKKAHFGKFLKVHDELREVTSGNPAFEPANPVIPAYVKNHADITDPIVTISDPFTLKVAELFNASYETAMQILTRYFLHVDTSQDELGTLSDSAVGLMSQVLRPLGRLMTTLPVGPDHPGKTAGPAFEVYRRVSYVLPHRQAAWVILHERLTELADFSTKLKVPKSAEGKLEPVSASLSDLASKLEVHAGA
ncbi:MAG: ferritin-like protein [Thaumarchaeota archaeon]|nr:ferritin-like protein [Nitrososphaerota archaeon]